MKLAVGIMALGLLDVTSAQPQCKFNCGDNCYRCGYVGGFYLSDGTTAAYEVTIDLTCCKAGETLSWASCCRDANCEVRPNECNSEDVTAPKWQCNTVTSQTFLVDAAALTFDVQVHDGNAAGNWDGTPEACGGTGTNQGCRNLGATNGVCEWTIILADCDEGDPEDTFPYCDGEPPCPNDPPGRDECCPSTAPNPLCECGGFDCCPDTNEGCCSEPRNPDCDCDGIVCEDEWECKVVCEKKEPNNFCNDPAPVRRSLNEVTQGKHKDTQGEHKWIRA